MAREEGSKAVVFTPAEMEQLSLNPETIQEDVKQRLDGTSFWSALPEDVREIISLRANGLGISEVDVATQLIRKVFMESMPKRPESKAA